MFSKFWNKIREVISKLISTNKGIEQALHIKPTISQDMINAIELWSDMYKGRAPWIHGPSPTDKSTVKSLGLPAFIASEKARMAVLEMNSEITSPMEATEITDELTGLTITDVSEKEVSDRAVFLNKQYQNTVIKDIRTQLEYGIAKGGLVIKPYVVLNNNSAVPNNTVMNKVDKTIQTDSGSEEGNALPASTNALKVDSKLTGHIAIDYIQADNFYPISFDASGNITEAAFVQRLVNKGETYSRLEYHKLNGNNSITIINKAYKSYNNVNMSLMENELGKEISLKEVPQWAELQPETTIQNVNKLLFGYFKMPNANTIDTYSPLGVSGFSRAVDLIRDADEQYSRLLWEFEGSELAIDVDRDALKIEKDASGRDITVLTKLQDRLYRKIDLDDDSTWNVFSPAIRDVSILNGLNNILMKIENNCELAWGTLSEVSNVEKTATEIIAMKQRSYAANENIQKSLEHALRDVIYAMDIYATLYNLAPEGEYEVSFEWDDSIKTDKESEMMKRLTLLDRQIISKVEYRMWYFGETEQQAVNALTKIAQLNSFEAQSMTNDEEDLSNFTDKNKKFERSNSFNNDKKMQKQLDDKNSKQDRSNNQGGKINNSSKGDE